MRNIDTKIDNTAPAGTGRLPAAQFNALADEVENVATSAGLTLDPAAGPDTDLEQVAQAIARYASAAVFGTDSGAANTYVVAKLGSYVVPKSLFNGLRVLFYPAHSNSGAATVNVFGLGVKPLVDHAGAALASGAIIANRLIEAVYDAGNSVFKLAPWANALLFSGGGGGGGGIRIAGRKHVVNNSQFTSGAALPSYAECWRTTYQPVTAGNRIVAIGGGEFTSTENPIAYVNKRSICAQLQVSADGGATWTQLGARMDWTIEGSDNYEADGTMEAVGEFVVPAGAPPPLLSFRLVLGRGAGPTPSVGLYPDSFINIIEYTG